MSTVVGLLHEFGSHEPWCANFCKIKTGSVFSCQRTNETEINYFDVKIFIQEDVLGLQVPMCKAFAVKVVNACEKLLEIVSGKSGAKGTIIYDILKHLTTRYNFLNDVCNFQNFAITFLPKSSLLEVVITYKVAMTHLLKYFNFLSKLFHKNFFMGNLVQLNYFDSVRVSVLV